MITFILGEDRHVKYFVHSIGQYDYFVIKDAKFSLLHNGKQEAAGVCTIEKDEEKNGYYVDVKIQPVQKKQDVHLRNRIKNCR
ncbi:hypothetical protein [Anaerostipes hadrus]|uniref:hypothetical protein n=1 Tax=Anaerostipes hadrus TaxID=649756 RepID=UPI001FD86D61|nr:hypothetical protein [Anaerostipes hadrus]